MVCGGDLFYCRPQGNGIVQKNHPYEEVLEEDIPGFKLGKAREFAKGPYSVVAVPYPLRAVYPVELTY